MNNDNKWLKKIQVIQRPFILPHLIVKNQLKNTAYQLLIPHNK